MVNQAIVSALSLMQRVMTVQTTEPTPPSPAWSDEAEIDLRQYIEVLIRWRREIALITLAAIVLAVVGVLALEWLQTPQYEASAEVAIVRTVSDVQFDERFRTEPEETTTTSANARRLALVVLASSPAVAQEVLIQLSAQLDADEYTVDDLLDMVEATVSAPEGMRSGDSDLIRIQVTADDPEKAALIANAWAAVFVRTANLTYGQVPDELSTSVTAELAKAESDYRTAQAALEEFLARSRSDEINNQIVETQELINVYGRAGTANRLAAFETEQLSLRRAFTGYVEALSGAQALLFEQQTRRDVSLLENYYSNWITTTVALDDVRALRLQVEQGGNAAAASSVLAVQLLKARLYSGLPAGFELQLSQTSAPTASAMLQDLDGMIAALEAQQTTLAQQIDQVTAGMLSGENYLQLGRTVPFSSTLAQAAQAALPRLFALGDLTQQGEGLIIATTAPATDETTSLTQKLAELQEQLRTLKAAFEANYAQQLQLTQKRDLAWETFRALSNKAAELNLTRAASNSEVRLAASAVMPTEPVDGTSVLFWVMIAGFSGLMSAVLIALLANYLNRSPFLTGGPA